MQLLQTGGVGEGRDLIGGRQLAANRRTASLWQTLAVKI